MKNSNSYAKLLLRPSLIHDIDQERAGRRLREFVGQAWHVVEPATAFVPGWHLDALCEHLEGVTSGQIQRLLISMHAATYEIAVGDGVLVVLGMDPSSATALAICQLCGRAGHPRFAEMPAADGKLLVPESVGGSLRVDFGPEREEPV